MRNTLLKLSVLGFAALGAASAAQARVDLGINLGVPAPVYVAPAPVYAPPPPPVVYEQPAPVYVGPEVVVGWHGDRYWDGRRYWNRGDWYAHHPGYRDHGRYDRRDYRHDGRY